MRRRLFIFVLAAAGIAAPASAQTTPNDIISFLVTNQAVSTGDFQKDQAAAAATRDTIARALLINLTSAPIGTSSSGFVYRLDPELGTMTRVSQSFGTFFVERAATGGRGHLSLGASATHASYDQLDGLHLDDGTLVTTANQFTDEAAPFDVESLTLRIRTNTLTVFGSYGITDRLELGAALPLVQLHIEGSRTNVYRGQTFVQASGSADASGIADVAIRAKYAIVNTRQGAFGVATEVRLPTGNEDDLLGAGRSAVRVLALGSAEGPRLSVHGNAGFVRGGASDEITAGGAVTVALSPRVTASGETLVRRLSDLHGIVPVSQPHPTIVGVETLRLLPGDNASMLSSLVTGVKWNVAGTLVVSGQVQWRLGHDGLTAPWAPSLSFDYLF
ncbi:MAG TPA: transporter [Vicinamibacterales bacterium]|jgi:hypothetical protein|nr:transporter [Vicinamibacterales bacterium]